MAKKKPDQDQGKEKRRGHGEGSWQYLDDLDKWKFRVSAKDPDGVTRRFSVTATTKGECRELAKARAEQIEKGIGLNIDTKNITVAEYLERWLQDYVNPSKGDATKRIYKNIINHQLAGKIGEIQLKKLQRPAVQRHLNEMGRNGSATATISLAQTVLRGALQQAVNDKIIAENPATGVKIPKIVNKERKAYSSEEVRKILLQAKGSRYEIGIHLMFGVALRQGEVLGLRWKNVDLDNGRVNIVEQLARQKGFAFTLPKSASSIRTLPLSPDLVAELKSWRIKQKEMLLKAGIAWSEEITVLSNEIGTPVTHDLYLLGYKQVVRAAGLETTGCHDARHTRLTLLAAAGIDARTLSSFAGHADVAFTLQVYVTPSQEAAAAAVNQVDKAIYQAK